MSLTCNKLQVFEVHNSVGPDLWNHPHHWGCEHVCHGSRFLLPLCILASCLPSPNHHNLLSVTVDQLAFSRFLCKWNAICSLSWLALFTNHSDVEIHPFDLPSRLPGTWTTQEGTELDTGHKGRPMVVGRPLDLALEYTQISVQTRPLPAV